MGRVFVIILTVVLIFSWVSAKKPSSISRKEDIPFIKCQVCEKLGNELYNQVKKKESEKKVSEFEIIEISENVCNLKKEEADWILRMDYVKKDGGLQVKITILALN